MNRSFRGFSKDSFIYRSFRLYFEPLSNFFHTKYLMPISSSEGGSGAQSHNSNVVSGFGSAADSHLDVIKDRYLGALQGRGHDFEPPRGDVETKLASIWQAVLGCELVSRQDTFWGLGGKSSQVSDLLSKIYEQFQIFLTNEFSVGNMRLYEMAEMLSSNSRGIGTASRLSPIYPPRFVPAAQNELNARNPLNDFTGSAPFPSETADTP